MLEGRIDVLITALEQNTNALLNGPNAPKVLEETTTEPEGEKPETVKQKKGRGSGKGRSKAASKQPGGGK